MEPNRYQFHATWNLGIPPDQAYQVLENIPEYPTWWPEVKLARPIDTETCAMTIRSLLPYELNFVIRESRRDPVALVLEATMTGDLDGISRWTITAATSGSTATFEENVVARKPLLRRLALIGRPAFRANHTLMMRRGKESLDSHLATAVDGSIPAPTSGFDQLLRGPVPSSVRR